MNKILLAIHILVLAGYASIGDRRGQLMNQQVATTATTTTREFMVVPGVVNTTQGARQYQADVDCYLNE